MLSASEREVVDNAVLASHKLFIPYGTTITNGDRITSIVSNTGATLVTQAEVESINKDPGTRQSHGEVKLKEVRE